LYIFGHNIPPMEENQNNRRPIATRETDWAKQIAAWLAAKNVSPNAISLMSIVFSGLSLLAFWMQSQTFYTCHVPQERWKDIICLILAIVFIQLRLLMNMLDGMVAVEHNRKSIFGGLYNEVPDRVSDALTLLGVGFAVSEFEYGWTLTWLAIFLSIMTAYIRALGASLGTGHFFSGPMAKPHRMAFVCFGCVIGIFWMPVFYYLLIVMNIGLVVTCYRRLAKIVTALKTMNP
jgi:phosphatidylglycerophosphate synthase